MGWLLTIWLSLPLTEGDLELNMWFSRESYCTFAQEKFLENPIHQTLADGRQADASVIDSGCRKLDDNETALIPEHMRK